MRKSAGLRMDGVKASNLRDEAALTEQQQEDPMHPVMLDSHVVPGVEDAGHFPGPRLVRDEGWKRRECQLLQTDGQQVGHLVTAVKVAAEAEQSVQRFAGLATISVVRDLRVR